jgi:MoxR-like ATPase
MRANAEEIAGRIDARGFRADEDINLGTDLTDLAELYQKGTIFYKAYHKGAVPPEEELQSDLRKMMDIYAEYARKPAGSSGQTEQTVKEGEEELSIKGIIANIKNYIAAKGFSYEDGLIENFYLCLKSKPFVILAGTSGTGKTRLVKLFAEAVGATTGNGRYKMVSVRPDWSDSSDLFGHVDLNGQFIPGAIIDFVKQAEIDSTRPYFLCLDEMNLARVEYYLSDVLSVIETRDFVGGRIESDPLVSDTYYGADKDAAGRYGIVRLPENLYIIGTVNMDETTFPFSRKVLDRANTIEFSYVDLMPNLAELPREVPQSMSVDNAFMKTEYLLLGQCAEESEAVNTYCLELQRINQILQKASAHVGYRVRDEIVFYMLANKKNDLIPENAAMDNELMQKILPRIQGSSASVKNMLCELFKLCAGDYDGYQAQSDNISDKMKKTLNDTDRTIKYRHSAEKIELMTRRFEEDGFTSYWL